MRPTAAVAQARLPADPGGEGHLVAGGQGDRGRARCPRRSNPPGPPPGTQEPPASSTDWSGSQPPGTQSVAERRTSTGSCSGQTARTAATTSRSSAGAVLERAAPASSCAGCRGARGTGAAGSRGPSALPPPGSRPPGRAAAASRKPPTTWRRPASSRARGGVQPASKGRGWGPPPASRPGPGDARRRPARGPRCRPCAPRGPAGCPGTAPWSRTKRPIRARGSTWSSSHRPRSWGLMRPSGGHGGGLGHDQSGAALGQAAQVHQVPVVGPAVPGRILAHGRHARCRLGRVRPRRVRGSNRGRRMVHSWSENNVSKSASFRI